MLRPHGLLAAHHSLGDLVLLLAQERRVEERHRQLEQGRVALLPAALPLDVVLVVDQRLESSTSDCVRVSNVGATMGLRAGEKRRGNGG